MYLRPRGADGDPVCTGDKHHVGDGWAAVLASLAGIGYAIGMLSTSGVPASSVADPSSSG